MTFEAIQPGLRGEAKLVVDEEHTARNLGSGGVRALATPQMVLLMERASVAAADHLLPEGYRTVGTYLDVQHLAPTPVGFEVTASSELLKVEGRRLTFRIQVLDAPLDRTGDQSEVVGEGTHQRFIVDVERFGERVARKAG